MATLTEDEENYVRLALLLKGLATKAVRTYFDKEFPPTSLSSTLNGNKTQISDFINKIQMDLLFPQNGEPNSETFDVTLMLVLLRNLTSVFTSLSSSWERTDLTTIQYYRNELAHPGSRKIDMAYFKTAWSKISAVVGRLGGPTLYPKCHELKVKILDQSNQEIMLEITQYHEAIRKLSLAVDDVKTNLEDLKSAQSTLQTEQAELKERVNDPIPQNIRGKMPDRKNIS